MPRALFVAATLFAASVSASAQARGVQGNWRTPGGAVVRIAPCGSDLCATLLQLEPDSPTQFDIKDPDPAKHTQRLCGMRIGYGFQLKDPDHAEDGHLYDPKNGKTYRGAMSSDGDHLSLRGYIGIKAFGRSEHWTRTTARIRACD